MAGPRGEICDLRLGSAMEDEGRRWGDDDKRNDFLMHVGPTQNTHLLLSIQRPAPPVDSNSGYIWQPHAAKDTRYTTLAFRSGFPTSG